MSPQTKPKDPKERMGVYQSLEDVPERRRFYQYADSYKDRDVWAEYQEEKLYERVSSERVKKEYGVIERDWKDFMGERGKHHSLATPSDVDEWTSGLFDKWKLQTVYKRWRVVESFYEWLQWHTDHPHLYNPFLMAAAKDGASATIWKEKISRREVKQRERDNE